MFVQDFYTKYLELCRFVPELVPNEQERALRFEEKLNIELLSSMVAADFVTLNELFTRAGNAERIEERRKGVEKRKAPTKENIQQSEKGNTFSQTRVGVLIIKVLGIISVEEARVNKPLGVLRVRFILVAKPRANLNARSTKDLFIVIFAKDMKTIIQGGIMKAIK